MKRVGYWISEKKSKKLCFEDQKELFRNAGVDLIKIDLDRPLEEQGPFDLLIHKATDMLIRAKQDFATAQDELHNLKVALNDSFDEGAAMEKLMKADKAYIKVQEKFNQLKDYIKRHPDCIVVDPLESMQKLLDRSEQYKLVLECDMMEKESQVFMPSFAELTTTDVDTNRRKLKEAGVEFPIVCKPTIAHGTVSHQMSLIFSAEGLTDVRPPCVAQTFINHNAVLYKLFVIGSKQFIVQRPSLKDMYPADRKTIFFDSQDVSKPDSSFFLNELDNSEADTTTEKPNMEIMHRLSKAIRSALKMDLIGVDVIVEANKGRYAVIDINAFPGYDGVDNFFPVLLDYMLKLMNNKQEKITLNTELGRKPLRETGRKLSDLSESEEAASRKKLKPDDAPDCNNCTSGANGLTTTCIHCRQSDSSTRRELSTASNADAQISDSLQCNYPVNGHVFELSERQQT